MPGDELRRADRPIRICGDDTLGVSFDDPLVCQVVAEQLRQSGTWLESVAGIDCVVVQFDALTTSLNAARADLAASVCTVSTQTDVQTSLVEVPVCYGGEFGPDLDVLCTTLGLSVEELIELHVATEYRVDMLGFTPGFAYVGGLPDELNVPRLARPRLRVEAGSVGIADGRSGLYAMPGPGGWPLIGRTPMQLFDPAADQPFVLHAGTRVRFHSIDADEFRQLDRQ
ncbi:MAG: 5-oxoprolinase subunit PxpB [Proteobacteria bacterium]|nr:5-oxoprolinase subunit PxpB [Pseudomonadota bacterium]